MPGFRRGVGIMTTEILEGLTMRVAYIVPRFLTSAWIVFGGAAVAGEAHEKLLYSFCSQKSCTDGQIPLSIMGTNDMLYGTTYAGGQGETEFYGTVFALNPKTGAQTVLHSFCTQENCTDGAAPWGNLIEIGNDLYGTAVWGGAYGFGVVFSVNVKTGAEKIIYSFKGGNDAAGPYAGLLDVKGVLYGTTQYGGGSACTNGTNGTGCGTVFSVDLHNGNETVLHSFQDNGKDGYYPEANLIDVNGTLYGTTVEGGAATYFGTIFSIDPATGAEKVLHSFQGNAGDGGNPEGALLNVNGTLYGTTCGGGNDATICDGPAGCGTIFSYNIATKNEQVNYFFCPTVSCLTGGKSEAALIFENGKLYGAGSVGGNNGYGAVFSFDLKSSKENVLYSFPSYETDGDIPTSGLVPLGKSFVGTTRGGGAGTGFENGCDYVGVTNCGTVFEVTP